MSTITDRGPVSAEGRALLEQVEQHTVWWHPALHPVHYPAGKPAKPKTSPNGGWVRYVGGRTLPFGDLAQLIALWELVRDGHVVAAPAPPSNPEAMHQPRPAVLTATGLAALRGSSEDTRK